MLTLNHCRDGRFFLWPAGANWAFPTRPMRASLAVKVSREAQHYGCLVAQPRGRLLLFSFCFQLFALKTCLNSVNSQLLYWWSNPCRDWSWCLPNKIANYDLILRIAPFCQPQPTASHWSLIYSRCICGARLLRHFQWIRSWTSTANWIESARFLAHG